MLGAAATHPLTCCAALRDIKAEGPACFGGQFHCTVQWHRAHRGVRQGKGRRLWRSSGMIRGTIGYRVCERAAVTSGSKLAAWTKRKRLSGAGPKRSSCKAARRAATNAPPRRRSRCCRQIIRCSPIRTSRRLRRLLPMAGPFAAGLALEPTRSGWGLASSRASGANATPIHNAKDRVVAAGVGDTARHLIFGPEFPQRFDPRVAQSHRAGMGRYA